MYTKPIIYKIFSIVVFVGSCIACIGSITSTSNLSKLADYFQPLSNISGSLIMIVGIVVSLFNLFFSYVSCSSMFTFARMIEHEQSADPQPFVKPFFALSGNFYVTYGKVIFIVNLISNIISAIAVIIISIVAHSILLAVPALISMFLFMVIIYIEYICRYTAFGVLLDIKSSNETSNANIEKIKEIKFSVLRGYCIFLFVLFFIILIGSIALCVSINTIIKEPVFATVSIIYIAYYAIIYLINVAVSGCFCDNLAKMTEEKLIKYKLL